MDGVIRLIQGARDRDNMAWRGSGARGGCGGPPRAVACMTGGGEWNNKVCCEVQPKGLGATTKGAVESRSEFTVAIGPQKKTRRARPRGPGPGDNDPAGQDFQTKGGGIFGTRLVESVAGRERK